MPVIIWQELLKQAGIDFVDVYLTRAGAIQFEAYGDIMDTLNKLLRAGIVGTGKRDWVCGKPYSIVTIIEGPDKHVACMRSADKAKVDAAYLAQWSDMRLVHCQLGRCKWRDWVTVPGEGQAWNNLVDMGVDAGNADLLVLRHGLVDMINANSYRLPLAEHVRRNGQHLRTHERDGIQYLDYWLDDIHTHWSIWFDPELNEWDSSFTPF